MSPECVSPFVPPECDHLHDSEFWPEVICVTCKKQECMSAASLLY